MVPVPKSFYVLSDAYVLKISNVRKWAKRMRNEG